MMLVALRRALTDATTAGDRALQAKRATRLVTHSIDVAVAALQEAIRVVEAKG